MSDYIKEAWSWGNGGTDSGSGGGFKEVVITFSDGASAASVEFDGTTHECSSVYDGFARLPDSVHAELVSHIKNNDVRFKIFTDTSYGVSYVWDVQEDIMIRINTPNSSIYIATESAEDNG